MRGNVMCAAMGFLLGCLVFISPVRADIYEWDWVDPNNPALGKVVTNIGIVPKVGDKDSFSVGLPAG